jgi:hypothetical protein
MKQIIFPRFEVLNPAMTKKIIIVLSLVFGLAGCGGGRVLTGLSPDEIRVQPTVMIANCAINCPNVRVAPGAVFSIEEIGGREYHIHSISIFSTVADLVAKVNTFTFPENALLLSYPYNEGDSYVGSHRGFIVYPNGKFAYEEYFAVAYNTVGGTWWMIPGECTSTCEYPFRLQDNR